MQVSNQFNRYSKEYKLFRPTYPETLFQWLSDICPEHKLAIDCGTGNGQAANQLAKYFSQVVGIDKNLNQIKETIPRSNVEYLTMPVEELNFKDNSVDLIIAASAVHWFELNSFYAACKRVLKSQGYIAVWTYTWPETDNIFIQNALIGLKDKLAPFWPRESLLHLNKYQTLHFPFVEITAPSFQIEVAWTIQELCNFLLTWAAIQQHIQSRDALFPTYMLEKLSITKQRDEEIIFKFPLYMRVGKI